MKHRLSITVEEDTVLDINETMRKRLFRNKSDLIERAIRKFLEDYNA